MRARKEEKRKVLIVALSIVAAIFLTIWFFVYHHNSFNLKSFFQKAVIPKTVIWSIDKIYFEEEKDSIEKFVQQSVDSGMFNFDTTVFYKELKENSKLIKNVEWDFSNPDYAKLNIYGVTPKYLINNKFVLGNKKRLFDKRMFEKFDKDKFVSLNIIDAFLGEKLDINVYNFLNKTANYDLLDKFKIAYFDSTNIEMLSKHSEYEYLIKTDEKNFGDVEKLDFVDSLYSDLIQELKNNTRKYRNKIYSFDLRFGDRFYVRTLNRKTLKHKIWGGGNG